MRITIIGTGALACLFGARITAVAPHAATLVGTWPAGLAALQSRGILFEEAGGAHVFPVQAVRLGQRAKPAEIVLVLVKAWQTAAVAPYLPDLVTPDGVIVTLQNGLGNVEQLGPQARVGVTALGATLLGPGHVRAGGYGPTHLAAPPWVAEVLHHAGFDAQPVDVSQAMNLIWGKLAANCGINALTALLRVPNGELLHRPDASQLMERAAVECAMVAWAQGFTLPYGDPMAYVRRLAERTAANHSSMLQDVQRGAPTEIDAINGAVTREGYRLGINTTVNELLWRLVRALTRRSK